MFPNPYQDPSDNMLPRSNLEAWPVRNEKGYSMQKTRFKLTGTQRLAPGVLTLHPTFFPTIPDRSLFSNLFTLLPYVISQANKFQMFIATVSLPDSLFFLSHTEVYLHARDEH